ncbi:MAG: hypothetical protein PVG78_19825 [Desulfobacterales bacterium]
MPTILRNRFDFDIGYLVKSPCRECSNRGEFPGCLELCPIIDNVQRLLAAGISSSRSQSNLEDHTLHFEGCRKR